MTLQARSILVVDDDDTFRNRLVRAFADRGLDAAGAASLEEAAAKAGEESPEFAVVDLRVGRGSGLMIIKTLLSIDETTRAVVLTGYGSIATAVGAMKLGAVNYLQKPADADQILAAFGDVGLGPDPEPPSTGLGVPSLARVEWEHIQRVLSDCNGNISLAARLLRIHRRSLQRKLQKHPAPR